MKNVHLFIAHIRMNNAFVILFCIVGHLGINEGSNTSNGVLIVWFLFF